MINLSSRQLEIIEIVKQHAPITGEQIAEALQLSRPTIRSDLALLVMLGYIDAKPKVGYYMGTAGVPRGAKVEKLLRLKVKEVHGVPIVVRETATIHDAVVTLFLENVGSLIVVDAQGMLVGVISRKDLLKVTIGNQAASAMPVSLAMTRYPQVVTVSPDESVLEAARKMIDYEVDSLPVTVLAELGEQKDKSEQADQRVEVIGRITKTTMTELLLDIVNDDDGEE